MLKIDATNRGAADPDIAKLAAELQVESRVKAAEIARTRGSTNEIALICHWWSRRRGWLGHLHKVARMDRSDLLPHVYARGLSTGQEQA